MILTYLLCVLNALHYWYEVQYYDPLPWTHTHWHTPVKAGKLVLSFPFFSFPFLPLYFPFLFQIHWSLSFTAQSRPLCSSPIALLPQLCIFSYLSSTVFLLCVPCGTNRTSITLSFLPFLPFLLFPPSLRAAFSASVFFLLCCCSLIECLDIFTVCVRLFFF